MVKFSYTVALKEIYNEHGFEEDVLEWLVAEIGRCGVDWKYTLRLQTPSTTTVAFADENKALLFKMRWG